MIPPRLSLPTALIVALLGQAAVPGRQSPSPPTFLIFKYQHRVGQEIDDCSEDPGGRSCHSHFQLDFTGSAISLETDIRTDQTFRPISYVAKGQNSTRSFVDFKVSIAGTRATIVAQGRASETAVAQDFFTLQQDVPLVTQELLFAYWSNHGRPLSISLLPAGEVRIHLSGVNNFATTTEPLTRYTVHGVTWGSETVWLNQQNQIAAIVGGDAEEDRVEFVRPRYQSALKDFVTQAAEDAVADTETAARRVRALATGSFALTHATIIDPEKDSTITNATLVVRDGKLAAVGTDIKLPRGIRTLDATGKFILPGLWDTHAHFEQWEWGPAYLACGITSVRDVGNEIEFLVPVRNSLNAGRGLGPRMYAAGLIDSDPGSLTSEHAEDPDRARAIVRRYHELAYQEIKIYQSLKPELIPVVTAEAHRLGMKVTGHIPTGTDALTAVRDGMDMINHISFVTRVIRSAGTSAVNADSSEAKTAINLFLQDHTIIEPTLARSEFNLHPQRRPFSDFEPAVSRLPPELAIVLNNAGIDQAREQRAAVAFQAALDTTRILYQAGVPILAGSDQVVPGSSLHRELELLVQAGLSPLEAIRSATILPARVLGVTESGMIEPGMRADLVVLDGNPLLNISNVRRVHWTIAGGKLFQPDTLWHYVDIRGTTP
jgi:imidazolonepropionase-like amidohydrolase